MTAESPEVKASDVELPEVARLRQPRPCFAIALKPATKQATLVILQGEVDLNTAPQLRDAAARSIDQGARAIVVDLSSVSFIDASGLGVIVMVARRLGPGAVALVLPGHGLARIFRICGLDRLLEIHESREQGPARTVQHGADRLS